MAEGSCAIHSIPLRLGHAGKPSLSFSVRAYLVGVEQVDRDRFLVTIDGHRFASFCSRSRARAAGRTEARRLHMVALETARSRR